MWRNLQELISFCPKFKLMGSIKFTLRKAIALDFIEQLHVTTMKDRIGDLPDAQASLERGLLGSPNFMD